MIGLAVAVLMIGTSPLAGTSIPGTSMIPPPLAPLKCPGRGFDMGSTGLDGGSGVVVGAISPLLGVKAPGAGTMIPKCLPALVSSVFCVDRGADGVGVVVVWGTSWLSGALTSNPGTLMTVSLLNGFLVPDAAGPASKEELRPEGKGK